MQKAMAAAEPNEPLQLAVKNMGPAKNSPFVLAPPDHNTPAEPNKSAKLAVSEKVNVKTSSVSEPNVPAKPENVEPNAPKEKKAAEPNDIIEDILKS
jgi:hypothetical protein